ncbi:glycerate dehydrogenase [Xinfangfangia sp. D13-10-4-6]|uniref:NAD(P)-dependent oxidoreductase n=1 Tax=Pseudogemmobacter hezensis TaxID=2737662 RepID=UPI0015562297|nr:NAD(P)-dependent oxidoreductase [Pseudogemmobacter hezensis]NPD16771.1 glycerate dehydrogenase [Pseudogemmobacter hezensis]
MSDAVFVDCTPELRAVMAARGLSVPAGVTIHEASPGPAEMIAMCRNARVMFVEHSPVPAEVLDGCPNLRAIVFMGTGAGSYIDLEDAQRRGIEVRTTPGYGDRAVAEHALALLFAAARNIAAGDREIRQGLWQPRGGLQLQGLKLTVIGMGGIGTCLADMAGALGMRVAGWNRSPRQHPAYVADLSQALSGADAVSLHLGLNAQTQGILGETQLSLPRRGFVLINTARAGLVDEGAFFAALDAGQIGHAALDVFPQEPLPPGNPYTTRENVTLTPHAAYMTDAAYEELWQRTLLAYQALS